jgi:hypothetical protein
LCLLIDSIAGISYLARELYNQDELESQGRRYT